MKWIAFNKGWVFVFLHLFWDVCICVFVFSYLYLKRGASYLLASGIPGIQSTLCSSKYTHTISSDSKVLKYNNMTECLNEYIIIYIYSLDKGRYQNGKGIYIHPPKVYIHWWFCIISLIVWVCMELSSFLFPLAMASEVNAYFFFCRTFFYVKLLDFF